MIPRTVRALGLTAAGERDRPAILFLHGFMGSKSDWTAVMAALEGSFRCVAVDLPGHGTSLGLPPETYTIEGAARAVVGVLDELGIERPVVAGYSMGGRLALYLALRYPERCTGIFLESASPGLEDEAEREERRKSDDEKAARLEAGSFEEFLESWYRQPIFASLARDEGLLRRTVEARRDNVPAELARSLRGMGTGSQPSLWKELAGLKTPALAVAGGRDEKFVDVARRMAGIGPNVRAVVVDGAGHNVHAEAPSAYLDLLKRFLSSIP